MMYWPEEYDKYTTAGGYFDENGKRVVQDGLHISADAPPEVKKYFQDKIEFYKTHDFVHADIIIH